MKHVSCRFSFLMVGTASLSSIHSFRLTVHITVLGSDVDDVECTHIAEALTVNTTLLSLSLRNNKIGSVTTK